MEHWQETAINEALRSSWAFPFDVNDYFHLCGFSRKDRCLEFIQKNIPSYQFIRRRTKVQQRSSDSYLLSRPAFKQLMNRSQPTNPAWNRLFLTWKIETLRKRVLAFERLTKDQLLRRHFITEDYVKGFYHVYPLDTISIANELDLNPLDVFRFCFDHFAIKYPPLQPEISFGNKEGDRRMPSYKFTSYFSSVRALVVDFLCKLISHFQLNGIDLQVANAFKAIVSELHEQQCVYDRLANRPFTVQDYLRQKQEQYWQKQKQEEEAEEREFQSYFTRFTIELSTSEQAELNSIYHLAAFVCHPDRLPEEQKALGHEWFVQLNNAKQNNDLVLVKKLYPQILASFPTEVDI